MLDSLLKIHCEHRLNRLQYNSKLFTGQTQCNVVAKKDFHFGKLIGSGGFNDIRMVQRVPRGTRSIGCDLIPEDRTSTASSAKESKYYAVKQLRQDLEGSKKINGALDLAAEARFLTALSHPNIINLYSTGGNPGDHDFFLVIECLESTVADNFRKWNSLKSKVSDSGMSKNEKVKEKERLMGDRLKIMFEVSNALKYLHEQRVIFRDVKPENVGLHSDGHVKIFDFGLAKELRSQDLVSGTDDQYHSTQNAGTKRYMAPEVFLGSTYGLSADVYSYAILMWEVVAIDTPFTGMTQQEHTRAAYKKKQRPKLKRSWPTPVKKIMQMSWAHKPSARPDMATVSSDMEAYLASTSLSVQ